MKNNKSIFKKGEKIKTNDGGFIRIMAIEEGYIMARRKNCIPFVQTEKEFIKRIKNEQK